jgi:hypothetical protein
LELTEMQDGWVEVIWKVPVKGDRVLGLTPVFPDFFEPALPPSGRVVKGAYVQRSTYRTNNTPLTAAAIEIEGLAGLSTEVLLRIKLFDGTEHSAVLRASSPRFTIPVEPSKSEVAVSYWQMGAIHILEGYDHLLFLLTLLLIVSGIWPLLKTVTAFTLAHSITLALATLGIVNIPPVPTEAVISLSIVLLAVEAVRKSQGKMTMAERYPWLIAFTFGLVHGLGFAGALSEIGIPQNEVPLALLMFNVGVETGQVLFVVVVAGLLAALAKISSKESLRVSQVMPYAIGGIASFWTIQRVVAFI